jgi:hypothetical protein
MILLKATTETISLLTSSTADIDYSISWVDITTSAFSPSTSEGKINTATTTSVLAAPAAATQRQIKLITISNIHATTANTVTVQKLISATTYNLTPATTLLAGESLIYVDSTGWSYYSASGTVKSGQTAAGSNQQIQFNSSGVLAGDSHLTWDNVANNLTLSGTNTGILLKGITAEPAAPSTGNLQIYSKAVSGKMQLKMKGPSGLDTPLQVALWQNNTVLFTPGAAAGNFQGTVGSTLGTAAIGAIATTNLYTMMRKSTFASVVTTTNQQVGIRTESMFARGNATGLGGFLFVCRFGFTSIKTGCRAFVGLSSVTTTEVTGDPSAQLNQVGFGFDLADTAWTFMHNDGVGISTKDAIAGQAALATNNTGYDAYIWCAPNDTTVYYRLDRIDTGATICDTSTATDLPVNTTLLTAQCVMSNGTANIVANDATLGINRLYVETDR